MRFPGFTDEWEETTIGKCTERLCNGLTYDTTVQDGIKVCRIETIHNKSIDYTRVGFYNGALDNVSDYLMKTGDILFSHINSLPHMGKTAIYAGEEPLIHGMNLLLLRGKSNINPYFLYYRLNTNKIIKRFQIIAKPAVNQASISTNDLRGEIIRICDESEQDKIAKFLHLIDERIATQNKIIDNLQSLIKGLNDSFHENAQGEAISFDEIGSSYSGLSGKSGDDFGQGSPFITYLNVYQNNTVNEKQVDFVTVDPNEDQNTVSYGDLLFTLSSETPKETGIGCVYLGLSGKYYLNSFCFGITIINPNKAYPPYLAYLVSSSNFRRFVYPLAQGSTRFNLQKNDFMKKKFILLPLERQKEISTILDTLNQRLVTESKLMELYKKQKDHLLRTLFI